MKYKLDDIDKNEVFKVPDGYFEDLPLKIQNRIQVEPPVSRSKRAVWSLAMAASMALIVTFVFINPGDDPTAEELLAEVSQDELIAYLDYVELDEYDIASTFEGEDGMFEFEDSNVLDGIDLDNQALDDVLLEYDLEDEYL
ncbi:hypothetical protein SAMN05421640_1255 [Ekhidna lutea]|uniref:Uncharacterized protein n=1 Tax=Ekhidna lutea TaxID=447679 RepID=A0A239HD61_EKHLU|nr:hypothetical protein [Ekhidna lutea]SNS79327.1 hypothetical protein SAMN05421640_1255 [Ekhidna lutea]